MIFIFATRPKSEARNRIRIIIRLIIMRIRFRASDCYLSTCKTIALLMIIMGIRFRASDCYLSTWKTIALLMQSDSAKSDGIKSDWRIRWPWSRQILGQNLTTRPMGLWNRKMASVLSQVEIYPYPYPYHYPKGRFPIEDQIVHFSSKKFLFDPIFFVRAIRSTHLVEKIDVFQRDAWIGLLDRKSF